MGIRKGMMGDFLGEELKYWKEFGSSLCIASGFSIPTLTVQ